MLDSIKNLYMRELHCADFQFPNGDTFVLQPKAVDFASAVAVE